MLLEMTLGPLAEGSAGGGGAFGGGGSVCMSQNRKIKLKISRKKKALKRQCVIEANVFLTCGNGALFFSLARASCLGSLFLTNVLAGEGL